MIDAIDKRILTILQEDARITNADIARQLKMTPSAALERVKKLKQRGIIQRYETRLDAHALGLELTTFIMIRTEENIGLTTIGDQIARFSEVQEVHFTTGEYCYIIKARVRDTDALTALLKKIGAIKGVKSSQTTLVLTPLKESLALAMD